MFSISLVNYFYEHFQVTSKKRLNINYNLILSVFNFISFRKQKPSALAGLVGEVTKMATYLKIVAH